VWVVLARTASPFGHDFVLVPAREGSAFAGRVGAKPRGVEPVGGAGLPPGIIKSTSNDHLMWLIERHLVRGVLRV